MEAQVLEHQHLAGLEASHGITRADPQRMAVDRHGHLEQRAQPLRTGRRRADSTTLPLGRPRWLISTTDAPLSSRYLIVGSEALMRESSLTLPSSIGTL